MKQSKATAVFEPLARLSLNGAAAVFCVVAAMAAWIFLAFDSIAGPGLQPSYARRRRGRAG